MHWSILTNPQVTDSILAPLDLPDFEDAATLVDDNNKSKYPKSLISASFNEKAFVENRSSKTGVASESLVSTFNAVTQGMDLKLTKMIPDEKGFLQPAEFGFKVKTIDANDNVKTIVLNQFSSSKGLKGLGNTTHRTYEKQEDGTYKVVKTYSRTKSLNINNLQSIAVDNAKNGNMGKGNMNDFTMAALNTLTRLESSDESNNVLPMNSLIWMIKQQAVLDYVREVQTLNDTTVEDFNPNKKQEMIIALLDKYMDLAEIKKEGRDYTFDENYELPVELSNDASNPGLFELLNNPNVDRRLWAYQQMNILKLFVTLDELGALDRDTMSALNSDSKGVGKSLITSNLKEKNFTDVVSGNKKSIPNIDGNPIFRIEGMENVASKNSQIGQATENSVVLANSIYSKLYPYKSIMMERILDIYTMFAGKKKATNINEQEQRKIMNALKSFIFTSKLTNLFTDVAAEKQRLLTTTYKNVYPKKQIAESTKLGNPNKSLVSFNENLENGVYRIGNTHVRVTKVGSYQLQKGGSLTAERIRVDGAKELLTEEKYFQGLAKGEGYSNYAEWRADTVSKGNFNFFNKQEVKHYYTFEIVNVEEDNQSLAKRLSVFKKQYPNNYFLKRLLAESATDLSNSFDLVKYSSSVTQKLDDIENTRAFAELLTSDDDATREFANDLIKYAFITGGNQTPISFIKYIPAQVLMFNEFSEGLRTAQTLMQEGNIGEINYISFLRQYFQHNPLKAVKLDEQELFNPTKNKNVVIEIPSIIKIAKNTPTNYEKTLISIQNKLYTEASKVDNENLKLEAEKSGLYSENVVPKFAYIYDKNREIYLFEATEDAENFIYTRINTLGTKKLGATEYNGSEDYTESALESNNDFLSADKNELSSNDDRPIAQQVDNTGETPKIVNNSNTNSFSSENKNKETNDNIKPQQTLTTELSNAKLTKMLADIANKGGLNGELAKVLMEHPNVQKAKIGLFTQQEKDGMTNGVPPAAAFANSGEIKFDNEQFDSLDDFERTLLHEALHIATSNEWNAYNLDKAGYTAKFPQKADVLKTLDNFRERIKTYLNNGHSITLANGTIINKAGLDEFNKKQIQSGYKDYDSSDVGFYYGLTNTKEFISVLMTEPMMQEALSKIPYGQGKTLWDRIQDLFINFVKHLSKQFGKDVNKTVLSESVGNVLDLLTLRERIVQKEEKQVSAPIQTKQEIEKLAETMTYSNPKKTLTDAIESLKQETIKISSSYDQVIYSNHKSFTQPEEKDDVENLIKPYIGEQFTVYGDKFNYKVSLTGVVKYGDQYKRQPLALQLEVVTSTGKKMFLPWFTNKFLLSEIPIKQIEYSSNTSKLTNTISVNGVSVKTSVFKDGKEIGITLNKDQEQGLREFANYFDAWKNGKKEDNHFKLLAKGGRGKSSVTKTFIDYIKKATKNGMGMNVVTPTHKAGKVATRALTGKSSGYLTVASLINKIRNGQPIPKLLVFDEVSMVGSRDFDTIMKYAKDNNIFILSMGDIHQLPPIGDNNKISKFFDKSDGKTYYLNEPMRFGKESGIFAISESVANNLKVLNGGIEQYGNSEQGDVEIVSSSNDLIDNFMKYFYPVIDDIKEKSLVKIIAYGNNTVAMYNNLIRKRIFGVEAVNKQVLKGDILMGQLNWGQNPLRVPVQNSQDYIVVNEPEEKTGSIQYSYKNKGMTFNTTYLKLQLSEPDAEVGNVPKQVQWLDISKPENKEFGQFVFDLNQSLSAMRPQDRFMSEERQLLEQIESDGWLVPNILIRSNATKQIYTTNEVYDLVKKTYNLTNQKDIMSKYEELLNGGKLTTLDGNIQHGYAISSHKSQGSTYKTVLVDDKNISYREKDRLVNNLDGTFEGYEANHMRYVAFSRPTDKLIIFTEKQTGDKLVLSTDKKDNAIAKSSKQEIKKESLTSISDNIVSVESVDSFLKDLSPKERILFTKLKLNKKIDTQC